MTSSPLTHDTAPVDPLAGLSPATREAIADAERGLNDLQRAVTQREWLLITTALDRPRAAIIEDGGLRLLALAWVKEKHAHGGASWDVLLEMTDDELLALHGFPTEDDVEGEGAEALPDAGDVVAGDPHRP